MHPLGSAAAPGKRVAQQVPHSQFAGSQVFHTIFLPKTWTNDSAKKLPLIVECKVTRNHEIYDRTFFPRLIACDCSFGQWDPAGGFELDSERMGAVRRRPGVVFKSSSGWIIEKGGQTG